MSKFYGFPVFEPLPRWQRWALEAAKPRIEAQLAIAEALSTGKEFTPAAWFDMTMYATGGNPIDLKEGTWDGGDRELAEKRMQQAISRQMDKEGGR